MTTPRIVRRLFCCAPFALAFAVSLEASASTLRVELRTKVRVGKVPSLRLTAERETSQVTLELTRDDGQSLKRALGPLAAGESKDVELDSALGEHHYEGRLLATAAGDEEETPLVFDTAVLAALELSVDKARVDFEEGKLEATLSRPAASLEIRVLGADGSVLYSAEQDISSEPAQKAFAIRWTPVERSKIARLELKASDRHGFYHAVALTPWSVSIPHEQVNFDVDSDKIKASEEPKLQASLERVREALARYAELGAVKLFIAGHTDTQGSDAHNFELSRRRARSIAVWFAKSGLSLPIFFEGFGESALLVKTKDQVDEPRNRRVDYILALDEPSFKSKDFRPTWRRLGP